MHKEWFLTFGKQAPKAASAKPAAAPDKSDGAEQWLDSKWLIDVMVGVRSLLQRTGAALAAAGTALIAGLGYAQLHNIFPIPKNVGGESVAALFVLFAAAIGGVIWLAAIFFMAQRRILIGTTSGATDDLDGSDLDVADRVRNEFARREQAKNLRAVELRAIRLANVARRVGDSDAKRASGLKAESDRLYGVVTFALVRAAATILEQRSRRAFRDWPTIVAVAFAAVGIIGVFAFADHFKGKRDLFQAQEKCAKAEANGIPNACAAFETPAQTKARKDAAKKKQNEADAKAKAASAKLSEKQRTALEVAANCELAVDHLPAKARPTGDARVSVVASCITAGS
jgi:hypothetical protein